MNQQDWKAKGASSGMRTDPPRGETGRSPRGGRRDLRPSHLFVYGTLRSQLEHPEAETLRRKAILDGPAQFPGVLEDRGEWPGARDQPNSPALVCGELWRLDHLPDAGNALLQSLDLWEGCSEGEECPEFVRAVRMVRSLQGLLPAWIWLLHPEIPPSRRIPEGDWVSYLRQR
ncbi:MAG: gamma-glutamylcyclotransferase [Fibrobacteria bacterium]|nr:gamma-glutamylcyclotransferase [Fibrobacteria bacterium]